MVGERLVPHIHLLETTELNSVDLNKRRALTIQNVSKFSLMENIF